MKDFDLDIVVLYFASESGLMKTESSPISQPDESSKLDSTLLDEPGEVRFVARRGFAGGINVVCCLMGESSLVDVERGWWPPRREKEKKKNSV